MEENVVEKSRSIHAVFAWLWLVAGADLLWDNSIADWLVAGGWCWFSMREQYCWLVGWQAKWTERIKNIGGVEDPEGLKDSPQVNLERKHLTSHVLGDMVKNTHEARGLWFEAYKLYAYFAWKLRMRVGLRIVWNNFFYDFLTSYL